jgi:hypothetical protein
VLGSSVVAVFNSSANCTFPFFPYLAAPPSLGFSDAFSVTIIAIGGGGGGGSNGGGGGGAGGVVIQTVNISQGQNISIVVGSGGRAAPSQPLPLYPAISGNHTFVTFFGSNITALGGGSGGTRDVSFL